jgi:DNA polymerase III epsilon subunit-like protein
MHLVFDLETTGLLPKTQQADGVRPRISSYKSISKYNKVRIVSIGWVVLDASLSEVERHYYVVKPRVHIPISSTRIHGISNKQAKEVGVEIQEVLRKLEQSMTGCKFLVAHNLLFDKMVMLSELYRHRAKKCMDYLFKMQHYCTMLHGQKMLKCRKFPRLAELYEHCSGTPLTNAHNALEDTLHCCACYKTLRSSSHPA